MTTALRVWYELHHRLTRMPNGSGLCSTPAQCPVWTRRNANRKECTFSLYGFIEWSTTLISHTGHLRAPHRFDHFSPRIIETLKIKDLNSFWFSSRFHILICFYLFFILFSLSFQIHFLKACSIKHTFSWFYDSLPIDPVRTGLQGFTRFYPPPVVHFSSHLQTKSKQVYLGYRWIQNKTYIFSSSPISPLL